MKALKEIGQLILVLFVLVYVSGFMYLYRIRPELRSCESRMNFYHKGKAYLYREYAIMGFGITFLLWLNAIAWIEVAGWFGIILLN